MMWRDMPSPLQCLQLVFNGGQQDGTIGGDTLFIGGTYAIQALIYSAPGPDGNAGSIFLDASQITYTGLEPIFAADAANTVLTFNTALPNNATLRNNPSAGLIEIVDNGSTFEDTQFPNPTNSLTINLGASGDRLNVAALDSAYAASLIINGGAGVDNVQFTGVTISSTPGRGLDVTGVETLGITGSTFSNNTADVGGGLHVTGGGNVTIVGGSVINNRATAEGGGLWNDQGTMTISGGTLILGNFANGNLDPLNFPTDLQGGGGIFNNGGALAIMGPTTSIVNNQATGTSSSGGGIFNRNSG